MFEAIPELELAYHFRWDVTAVFDDEDADGDSASARLEELREHLDPDDVMHQELLGFFTTHDNHRESILAYFDERKTSGVVEGLNNKARVITKRCYGVKSAKTLWNRLCLDVTFAAKIVTYTVQQIHEIANSIRSVFLGFYT